MDESETSNCTYESDPREACKYGSLCYQVNKKHHEKFKHPTVSSKKQKEQHSDQPSKKLKPNIFEKKTVIKHNDHSPLPKDVLKTVEKEKEQAAKLTKNNDQSDFVKSNSASPPSQLKPSLNNKSEEEHLQVKLKDKRRSSESKKIELKSNKLDLIKQLFLVTMPEDFLSFWNMCESLSKDNPLNALKDVKLLLVGPFDVLAGKVTEVYEEDLSDYLRHWRFYYDPPEFQTVLACMDPRCFHIGYYRDDPKEMPAFVASNSLNQKNPEKNGEITIEGPNLFAAFNAYLENLKADPFSKMKIPKFQKLLTSWAKENGFSLEKTSKKIDSRNRNRVTKTFHGAGIVVPVDKKNDIGYRELAASNVMIKKMLKGIAESKNEEERKKFWEQLQPVITFANIANDECDFGTSLELGLDLFTFGSPLLHRNVKQLLTTAYNLLGREEFAKIIEAHLENRRKGKDLSIF